MNRTQSNIILMQTAKKIAEEHGIHVTRSKEYVKLKPYDQKKVRIQVYKRLLNAEII
jgi:hypothetical protein